MAGYCSTDLGAMVSEDETVCGPCEPREPIVPNSNCTASLLQSPPVTHLPIHSSLVPSQPMALAYPALQLFYLLPGEQGSPPVLLPVLSSLPHGQPLFLPPLTCGPTPLQKSESEGSVGGDTRFEKLRGEFFRPWENGCSGAIMSKLKPSLAECQKFRPWEEASSPTQLSKGIEEDNCVTNMMKGMTIGHQMVE